MLLRRTDSTYQIWSGDEYWIRGDIGEGSMVMGVMSRLLVTQLQGATWEI